MTLWALFDNVYGNEIGGCYMELEMTAYVVESWTENQENYINNILSRQCEMAGVDIEMIQCFIQDWAEEYVSNESYVKVVYDTDSLRYEIFICRDFLKTISTLESIFFLLLKSVKFSELISFLPRSIHSYIVMKHLQMIKKGYLLRF